MLQGFYWDSFGDTKWQKLESQADEFAEFFKLVWIPQSGNCGATGISMGYNPLYWFENYTSSFGTEQELRSMISTFKQKGIGTIADVVVNHHTSLAGTWMGFPQETYKGQSWTLLPSDICKNDDGGNTLKSAETAPTGANDTGEDFSGARDLDHTSAHVQSLVKTYLKDFLLEDLGYEGFRYDMVKGYSASYTGLYNAYANPTYSVGEYWDGNASALITWIRGTQQNGAYQSAAFDFALKYNLRDACNNSNWSNLAKSSLATTNQYKRYGVTFVDNHDTWGRTDKGSETTKNIEAANAFILAAPGTPCIFLPHWKSYKALIKQMIYARNAAGLNNQSQHTQLVSSTSQFAMKTDGTGGHSVVVLMGGKTMPSGVNSSDYFLVSTGTNFAYYVSRNINQAWASVPSGTYEQAQSVKLNAVSSTSGAKIVYTLDGKTPTAASTQVADGTTITVSQKTTLKAGLLIGSTVSGIITRNYDFVQFENRPIDVYVNVDAVSWSNVNFHTWGDYRTGTSWPGDKVTEKAVVDGKTWYKKTYTLTREDDYVNFVFSTNTGTPQTVDVENVKANTFFEISASKDANGKYLVNDVTGQHTTGIHSINADGNVDQPATVAYTLDGRMLNLQKTGVSPQEALRSLPKGVYIVNKRKYVVR